ncbi:MAG: 23S rRNA (pseudouridine(1915)-N(3))-methyltransferase RlmH [Parvularculaceae bacterium]
MDITIGAVGRHKSGPVLELYKTYAARLEGLGRQIGLSGPNLYEVEAAKALPATALQAKEAELLVAKLPALGPVYILDEHGTSLSSQSFAEKLSRERDAGAGHVSFLLGGANGHGPAVRSLAQSRAATLLSFGPATWPHMLARAMLVEQLYRAATILAGHPYHRS